MKQTKHTHYGKLLSSSCWWVPRIEKMKNWSGIHKYIHKNMLIIPYKAQIQIKMLTHKHTHTQTCTHRNTHKNFKIGTHQVN